MVYAVGPISSNEHISEIGISQHSPKSEQALFQNLFSMSNEQQPARLAWILFPERLIVQCGNHRLARAGCSNHKIAGITPDGALRLQLIKNLLLSKR